jgi:osmoprotectant transport system permease protein
MHAFIEALRWLTTGSHWSGFDGIPTRVWEHVYTSLVAIAIGAAIALPVGLYIGHTRRFQFLAVSIANVGRAIPSFGILVIAYVIVLKVSSSLAFGFVPTVVALVLLSIPPIITNTYVGVQQVDADTVEAARGMGMTERQVLGRLELPLAAPLIMAGLRTAAVTVVATATLSALIGGGTVGRYIVDGLAQSDFPKTIAGAILVALLAILTELVLGGMERAVTPRTTSSQAQGRTLRRKPDLHAARHHGVLEV